MRINIPLLPISIEVRWRRLPPLRATLRGLMVGIVILGFFFALVAHAGRKARALSYHSEQAFRTAAARKPAGLAPVGGPTPLEAWHAAMAGRYRAEFERSELLAVFLFLTLTTLAAVAALGRVLDGLSRRLRIPTGDRTMDSRPTSPASPAPEPEGPRP